MKSIHILFPFLLLSFILLAFPQHYANSATFQETAKGILKTANAAFDTSQHRKTNRKEAYEQKVRKTPSGPSPIGNNRPPSKA
ncbi:CLAVATA 3/ESR protein [Salvia divinorum]|uniref:CLAVATA 3/ESR protein n=1 Tax=Salvia divinorum TaxID=28513 RepID=A0ABD1HQB5_SALDI